MSNTSELRVPQNENSIGYEAEAKLIKLRDFCENNFISCHHGDGVPCPLLLCNECVKQNDIVAKADFIVTVSVASVHEMTQELKNFIRLKMYGEKGGR